MPEYRVFFWARFFFYSVTPPFHEKLMLFLWLKRQMIAGTRLIIRSGRSTTTFLMPFLPKISYIYLIYIVSFYSDPASWYIFWSPWVDAWKMSYCFSGWSLISFITRFLFIGCYFPVWPMWEARLYHYLLEDYKHQSDSSPEKNDWTTIPAFSSFSNARFENLNPQF